MTSRRGFTLIELLVVMTAVTVIMAATVVLMHFVLQMDTEVRQRTQTVATVGRLAEQFRRDVHQARGEPVVADRSSRGRTPLARRNDRQVADRRASVAGSHGAGPRFRRPWCRFLPANREDSFTLPKGTTAALELQPQAAARIVTLRIESPGSGGPSLAIEALASRDERLAVEEEKP